MSLTIEGMAKEKKVTVQMRVPVDIATDLSYIASALGMEPNDYLTQLAQEGITRDMQKAIAYGKNRLAAKPKGKPPQEED